ncbi:MAG: NfeD family protein [Spirochaetes bacterium]|nr:NfeD family protein [Spirochaetota bacterium]
MDSFVIILLCTGGAIVIAEVFLPGGIAVAIGLSLIAAALLRHFGFAVTYTKLLVTWLIITPVLLAICMFIARRFFGGTVNKKPYDEDAALADETCEVIVPVTAKDDSGRVKWRGTDWSARSTGAVLAAGTKARIVRQDNLTLIIKTIPEKKERRK